MNDNSGAKEEDSLNHIHAMVNELMKEFNWELLKPDNNVPVSSKI